MYAIRSYYATFNAGVFNTHAGFKTDKMADVVDLMTANGAECDAESIATLEGFAALRRWLCCQETSYLDNRIRKSQSYSEIGNQPLPHYAMGLDVYATWTSPIRKYGDMINHRMLKAHILVITSYSIHYTKLYELSRSHNTRTVGSD